MGREKLTELEAARIMRLKPNTLAVWRCKGKGPSYSKVGRRILYDLDELQTYIDTNTVNPGAQFPFRGESQNGKHYDWKQTKAFF